MITVAAGTPAGSYVVTYQICDKVNTGVCDIATETVNVAAPAIDAVTETTPAINGINGGTTASLLANDTLNGAPVTVGATGNVTLTPVTVPAGLTLNADGTVTVASGTPAGNYNVTYQICDKVNPTNCDTVTSIVVVSAPAIDAVNGTQAVSAGTTGTTSVLANDTYNGGAAGSATLANVNLTQTATTNPGVTLNTTTGMITVAAGTPAGTYVVTYEICDKTNPGVCDTATETVTVPLDSDGDGVPDSTDLDDDNDGITDCDENLLGANASVSNVFSFVTAGTAIATSNNEVRLTQDTGNQAGRIWSVGKVDFTKSFVLRFDAYLGTRDNGADGIAAVFHNSPQGVNATGATGLGIGARGIANGIVLELDTYNNGTGLGDISSDHGQIWDSDNQTSTGFLTTAIALPELENSTWHPVVINWNATTKTISYTVDGTNAGTYTGDLVTNYFAGANKVYFGYTASTGGATNEQKIRINSFCSDLPLEIDTNGDGTPNSLDLDSDKDGCPDAIEGGDNVTAGMLDGIGRINVAANGTTTPVVVDANGVPVITNTGSTYNVDGQAQGQTAGSSANASVNGCYCYKPAQTSGTILDTNHGITALGRAGADNSNWPMVRKGAWTALEAKTKGFVVNRLTDAQVSAIPSADLREGMMVYNITQDCLQINIDGTATGWKCFNTQTCPDL